VINGLMQMKTDDSEDGWISLARIGALALGIIVLVIGVLVAFLQIGNISNAAYYGEQTSLLGDLCWVSVGMAVELFGIGLIIFGNRK
jgi:hypothetical protein